MITEAGIYDAFATLVTVFAGQFSPGLPVYYEAVPLDPPSTGQWLEVRMFPGEGENYGIEDDGPTVHRGFLQITVCQRHPGAVAPMELAAAAIAQIPKGTELAGARIIRKPYISSVVTEPHKIMCPVTFPYLGGSDSEPTPALFITGGSSDSTYTDAITLVGT